MTRTAPRQARSARSLDLILDAAERLLQDRGVVETSTVDVAAAAGVSVGRLYYWFPDKDAVVRAVLTRAEQGLRSFVDDVTVNDLAQSTPDLISNLVGELGSFFREHQGSLAVLQRGPVDGDDPGRALCHMFSDLVAQVVQSRAPGIPAVERDLVADTVVRIVIAMLAGVVRADDEEAKVYLDELTSVVTAYLQARQLST
jgi:AcrR family transcriptional regulator